MKSEYLGDCCSDCFAALNYNPAEMPPRDAEKAKEAGKKLSALCDGQGVQSLHTGSYIGFSHQWCCGCRAASPSGDETPLAGDRWQLIALKEARNGVSV